MGNKGATDLEALFILREMIDAKIKSIDENALSQYVIGGQKKKWATIDAAVDRGITAMENGEWKPKIRKLLEPEEDSWEIAIQKAHKRAYEIGFIEISSDLIDNMEQAFKELYNPPEIKK